MARLALIAKKGKITTKEQSFKEHEFELVHFDEFAAHHCFAGLNDVLFLPIWLLDLGVLNENGQCRMRGDQEATALLPGPWRKRFGILKERAKPIVEMLGNLQSGDEGLRAETLKALLRLPLGTPFTTLLAVEGKDPIKDWSVDLGLQRVGRLRERYATAILSQYGAYLARLAHPHDLTRRR